jgi:hypothetical protein
VWTSRSRTASATVGSGITSCHCSIGSWLVTMVLAEPWRSSLVAERDDMEPVLFRCAWLHAKIDRTEVRLDPGYGLLL